MPTNSGVASPLLVAEPPIAEPQVGRPPAAAQLSPIAEPQEPPATQVHPSIGYRPGWASEELGEEVALGPDVPSERQRRAQEVIEAQRTAARRAAREHLPSPADVAKEIALALFEVEAGRRSAAQLERVCTPELWELLEQRVQRHGGVLPSGSDLLRVHFQELVPGLANTVAVVQRGSRVQPVAMRLDACSGRWLVTELRY
jgi:hypothetical protein